MDEGAVNLLIGAVIGIGLWLTPTIIASQKGRSVLGWLLYGTFLWPIALIHALCLKDESYKCPKCYAPINKMAIICPHCHSKLDKSSK